MGPVSRRTFGWVLAGAALHSPTPGLAVALKDAHRIGLLNVGVQPPVFSVDSRRASGALQPLNVPPRALAGVPAPSSLARPLQELGWIEGQNLHVERRYDNGRPEALPLLAQELVRARVEVIVTMSTPATL